MLNLKGSIKTLKASEDTMGDTVNLLTLEVVGDIKSLHDLMRRPLDIKIEVEDAKRP